jgi:hypothetical protein
MRVIARKERPHPGAQLRLTDVDGHRVTCFATRARGGQLADLELAHRRRAETGLAQHPHDVRSDVAGRTRRAAHGSKALNIK